MTRPLKIFTILFINVPSFLCAATNVSGTISSNTTWNTSGSPYVVSDLGVLVNTGVTLTILPGVIVKMSGSVFGGSALSVNGTLLANGTTAQPIVFTSLLDDTVGGDTNGDGNATSPQAGSWGCLCFSDSSSGSISNAVMRYGGSSQNVAMILIGSGNAAVSITNSTLTDSGSAVVIEGPGTNPAINGNTFVRNNIDVIVDPGSAGVIRNNTMTTSSSTSAIQIDADFRGVLSGNNVGGTGLNGVLVTNNANGIIANTTWGQTSMPYVVSDLGVLVNTGVTLTILPGVIVKMSGSVFGGSALSVNGTLLANGTTAQPIVFTSLLDDTVGGDTNGDGNATSPQAGSWGCLCFSDSSSGSISNAVMRYGGSSQNVAMILIGSGNAAVSITNSTLTDSGSAVVIEGPGTNPAINGNTFVRNNVGVGVAGDTVVHIHYNNLQEDVSYGVLNVGCPNDISCSITPTVDAINNYWGSPSGPWLDPPPGPGDRASYHVNYEPFLGASFQPLMPPPLQTTLGRSGSPTNPTSSFAEPVNTATGNYYLAKVDLVVPGKGLPFNFSRSYNSQDTYSGPLGVGWTHSYNIFLMIDQTSGTVTIKQADGHEDFYSPTGGGIYTPQTVGLFNSLRQNTNESFTLTLKNQTQFNFSSAGQLATIVDRNGNTQVLGYDDTGRLTSVIDTSGRIFVLLYDANGHLATLTDPLGRILQYSYDASGDLASFRDALGGLTHYAYDATHHITSATDPRGITYLQNTYDTQGRVILQANARGFPTSFAYDIPVAGTTLITDSLGNVTQHVYDGGLRLINVVDALGGMVSYSYDANNNRTSITNQNGNTTNLASDAQGNTTGITDSLRNTETLTYDSKNDLVTSTNAKGNTTTFSYDTHGNLARISDALGNATAFAYGASGLLASKTDAHGHTSSYSYDSVGDLTRIVDALGNATNLSYDGVGRLLSLTDPNGHTATLAYDVLNRLVKTTDPLSNSTQFVYDGIGNLLKVTDTAGNTTSYAYDATNNLATVSDALGGVTTYSYDADNRRLAFKNANGNVTAYSYDALNHLVSITDPLSFSTSYGYDPVGNTVSTTDGNGKVNQYTYDALNRLASGSYADGSSVTFAYDKAGNRASMVDSRGTTSYSYDALDRVLSVTSSGGAVVHYAYDALGNRNFLTYPDGRAAQYEYDALSRLTQVTDWSGKATRYTYDAAGNLLGFTHPNGAASSYSYDVANRLLQIVNRSGSQVLSSFAYALDKVGNRLQATSGAGGVTKYGYDPLYRLISWTTPSGQATQYGYDAVGNRLTMVTSAGTTTYSYDAADRLLSAGTTIFSYDHNGNQILKTTGSTTIKYVYDTLNRLTAVSGSGINSRYQYDGDGNRTIQTVPTGSYLYLNDTAAPLPVVLSENGPDGNTDYLYGLSTISETSPAFQYYYQSDGLGSTASLTDPTGALKANYSYDPWGKLLVPIDPLGTKNKFKFTGEALDPGTGLYYLRARYYDPSFGRFTSRDPLGGTARNPLSKNRYSYAHSSPMGYVDRSGLSAEGFQFQSFLGGSFLDLGNAGSTLALAPNSCPNCVPFALAGDVVGLGGDLQKAVTGNDVPGLDLAGIGLDVAQRLENGQSLSQALLYASSDYAIEKAIGLAAVRLLGTSGGLILVTAYEATKVGADVGSIPAVESFVSQQEFSALNWVFGPTRVEQWSTSPVWTALSNFGIALTKLP